MITLDLATHSQLIWKEVNVMKITVKRVESIKATRIHLDPDAGGA